MAYPTGSFPILTVLLKRLFVCFGWGVRGGYSCSSYLRLIIFASSSPLRVPRPAILTVSSKFWVKNRYYHRAWVTCGQYGRHAFETSIVPADLSGPHSESFLIFSFCAFSSKNRLIPKKFYYIYLFYLCTYCVPLQLWIKQANSITLFGQGANNNNFLLFTNPLYKTLLTYTK